MKDLIILAGAPGSGKTTVGRILQKELLSPYIDFGWIREWHLLPDWSNQSSEEEEMAFENLVSVIKNYFAHGYKNVIVTDLKQERVEELNDLFAAKNTIIISLVLNNDEELRKRVLGERDSGFKNVEVAIKWNKMIRERPKYKNELKIDNTGNDLQKTADEILGILNLEPKA